MAATTSLQTDRELKHMQRKLKGYAPHFDSEKKKMELSLMLDPPVTVRTLQTYFAGRGNKFSFTKDLLEKVESIIKS